MYWKVRACLHLPGQYMTIFDIQTLKRVSITSRDFRTDWMIDLSGRNGQIDIVIELNTFSSCKLLELIQLLP